MRRAIRALAARPIFATVVVATLTLGFGVNSAIFSLTRTVLLRPLPYPDADRLVQVGEANQSRGIQYSPAVPANYVVWRTRASVFADTAAWRVVYFALGDHSTVVRAQGVRVEPSFFRLLGVTPALGRGFADADARAGRDDVVILGRSFWHRRFGGDPSIVGRTLTVDGTPCTVVGVLPEGFKFFRVLNHELDVWRPLVVDADDREHSVTAYAKLKPDVPLDAARAELAAIFRSLPAESFRDGWTPDVATLASRFTRAQRPILAALEVAVVLVMCIAAANIGNLILAVAAGRRKDLAVRVALGATRARLALDVGRETILLAAAGVAGGLLLAAWAVDLLDHVVSYQDINRLEPFRVDGTVVAFALALAACSAVVFALLPSRRAIDADLIDALEESSHAATTGSTHRRLRGALIVAELALAIVLLTSALELTRGSLQLDRMDRGVDVDRVMTAQLSLNGPRYDDARSLTRFADRLLPALRGPGIEAASLVNYAPLSLIGTSVPLVVDGQPAAAGQEPTAQYWVVAPGYFATVGVRLLAGRDFSADDIADRAGVTIVSRGFAQRFWGRTHVLGERLTTKFPPSDAFWIPKAFRGPLTVVGVVSDVREDGIAGPADDLHRQFYLPYAQNPTRIVTLVVRTAGPPAAAVPVIREAVRIADPDQPTFDERSLEDLRHETFARPRELALLVDVFAALAAALTAMGVYGVVAYLTTARTREIRIRMALGASRTSVVGLVVRDAMKVAAIGIALGALAAPIAFALLNASVPQLPQWSAGGLTTVVVLVAAVSAAAAALPGWRACASPSVNSRL
jgi:putative ABC transport system permease protein